jgi:hypothetical protein
VSLVRGTGLIGGTLGYVFVASLSFAALSVSPFEPFAFPVVVTLWTAYLWMFTAKAIQSFSTVPHSPRRVGAIIVFSSILGLAALVMSIVIGLLIIGPR